jgi:hypothetical protein
MDLEIRNGHAPCTAGGQRIACTLQGCHRKSSVDMLGDYDHHQQFFSHSQHVWGNDLRQRWRETHHQCSGYGDFLQTTVLYRPSVDDGAEKTVSAQVLLTRSLLAPYVFKISRVRDSRYLVRKSHSTTIQNTTAVGTATFYDMSCSVSRSCRRSRALRRITRSTSSTH